MPLLIAFVLLPMVEIALFILVGGWIGLWPTLGLVVVSALCGIILLRREGLSALGDLRGQMGAQIGALRNPLSDMARRAMVMLAAVLLIAPGFFTDAVAGLLLLRPVQTRLIAAMAARMRAAPGPQPGPGVGAQRGTITVIDGEYFEIDPGQSTPPRSDAPRPDAPRPGASGWTRPR